MDEQNNYSQYPNNENTGGSTDPYEYRFVPQQPAAHSYFQYEQPEKKKGGITRGGIALLVVVCLVVGLLSGVGGAAVYNSLTDSSGVDATTVFYRSVRDTDLEDDAAPYTTAEVSAAVAASVVEIQTEQITVSPGWVQDYVVSGAGSGVILSEDGYIITCAHVIDGSSQIVVILSNGTKYDATVIGSDTENDIAVLKIDAKGLTPAVIGSSDKSVVGEAVIAVGNPLGSLGGTVTSGIISALDREISVEGVDMILMQTDASVSPGNSGGGLFNSYAELIGIVNAKSAEEDTEGIGFAIPIDTAIAIAQDFIENGQTVAEKASLGVTVVQITTQSEMDNQGVDRLGVYISKVNSGGAAYKAGLKAGDYIMSIDGNLVSLNDDLTEYLATCRVGQTVSIQVIREERVLTFEVTLEQYGTSSYR